MKEQNIKINLVKKIVNTVLMYPTSKIFGEKL